MKRIQIVIPAINLWTKYTKPCINSIIEACKDEDGNQIFDYRILLIDKCSTDETKEEAGKLVSNNFSHRRLEENESLAASWNFGTKDGLDRGYEYIYIVNNDIILHKKAIKELIEEFDKKDSNIILISSHDVRGECTNPKDVLLLNPEDKRNIEKAEHPCYSAFMITKEYWNLIGEFDTEFYPAYFEDNSSHYKINIKGKKAIVLPTSLFYHYGSATSRESNSKDITNLNFELNRERYIKMWGGLPGNEIYKTKFNK